MNEYDFTYMPFARENNRSFSALMHKIDQEFLNSSKLKDETLIWKKCYT